MRGALLTPDGDDAYAAASLPEGWVVLGRCRFGTAGPSAYASGCHALAHPEIGIALLDIAPDATPNAEARLRRALGAAGFWSAVPGRLPIWHGRIEGAELPELDRILQAAFATQPPLSLLGGPNWIAALRQALAQDPAWEIPGMSPLPGTALVLAEAPEAPPMRSARRRGPLLFLGFVASFWLGLAAGLYLVSEQESAAPGIAASAARGITEVAVAAPAPSPVVAEPVADPMPPAPAPEARPPVLVEQTLATGSAAPPRASGPVAEVLVGPEPPGTASPRPVARSVMHSTARPAIDRTCSQALFRFQQGEALTAAERVHLREGCATHR